MIIAVSIIIVIIIVIIIMINTRASDIPGWRPVGDSLVSWVGRTLKSWLATLVGEGKL